MAWFFRCAVGIACCFFFVTACATLPNVTAAYFFPKASTQISVVQTLACNGIPKGDPPPTVIISAAAVSANTVYSSDFEYGRRGRLRYADLNGPFSDADVALTFTDDGRLSGINSSSTGQGSAIIKSAISVASALAPGAAAAVANGKKDITDICTVIQNYTPPPKPGGDKTTPVLTLTYTVGILYRKQDGMIQITPDPSVSLACDRPISPTQLPICPDANSDAAFRALGSLPIYTVEASTAAPSLDQDQRNDALPFAYDPDSSSQVALLDLNRVAVVNLIIKGPSGDLSKVREVWRGQYPVPLREVYQLPIPKAAIFGKQQFVLSLTNYGSVSKLEYAKNTGFSDALDSAAAVAKALQGPSAATQASNEQAISDLIYQTQRAAICRANPTACPSK